jgi:hypothetical protein
VWTVQLDRLYSLNNNFKFIDFTKVKNSFIGSLFIWYSMLKKSLKEFFDEGVWMKLAYDFRCSIFSSSRGLKLYAVTVAGYLVCSCNFDSSSVLIDKSNFGFPFIEGFFTNSSTIGGGNTLMISLEVKSSVSISCFTITST